VSRRPRADPVARHRLAARLSEAVDALPEPPPTPTYVADLDAFDLNAAELTARAGGKRIRLATKSLRVPALIERALATAGIAGLLTYSLREALWLHAHEICDDLVMGYPTADGAALRRLTADAEAAAAITLMVDDTAHLDLVDSQRAGDAEIRVALDVDAGLRLGRVHLGPRRSPLLDPRRAVAVARAVVSRPGFRLVGVMSYEGQVAGVPDDVPGRPVRSLAVRGVKEASVRQLSVRRAETAAALRSIAEVEFWNAGGSGSVETSAADPVVTEVTAGSGLLVPALFDHYRSFTPRPAAFLGFRVVRSPGPGCVTVAGGGLIASGPLGPDRFPTPWAPPGLRLSRLEGAGEVQTPLLGPGTEHLAVGDLVWFRHAKAGEAAEHVRDVHLLAGRRIVDTVPTYRGTGNAW
jgi:D-serine deaminase-like pyridoxal phosphate-dependent protein